MHFYKLLLQIHKHVKKLHLIFYPSNYTWLINKWRVYLDKIELARDAVRRVDYRGLAILVHPTRAAAVQVVHARGHFVPLVHIPVVTERQVNTS